MGAEDKDKTASITATPPSGAQLDGLAGLVGNSPPEPMAEAIDLVKLGRELTARAKAAKDFSQSYNGLTAEDVAADVVSEIAGSTKSGTAAAIPEGYTTPLDWAYDLFQKKFNTIRAAARRQWRLRVHYYSTTPSSAIVSSFSSEDFRVFLEELDRAAARDPLVHKILRMATDGEIQRGFPDIDLGDRKDATRVLNCSLREYDNARRRYDRLVRSTAAKHLGSRHD